jgi:hypothetical protein
LKVAPDVETKVMNPTGWEELKVRVPTVAVEDVPVTCGNEVEIDLAMLPSAITPFCMALKMSVKELGITCGLLEQSDSVSDPTGRTRYLPTGP